MTNLTTKSWIKRLFNGVFWQQILINQFLICFQNFAPFLNYLILMFKASFVILMPFCFACHAVFMLAIWAFKSCFFICNSHTFVVISEFEGTAYVRTQAQSCQFFFLIFDHFFASFNFLLGVSKKATSSKLTLFIIFQIFAQLSLRFVHHLDSFCEKVLLYISHDFNQFFFDFDFFFSLSLFYYFVTILTLVLERTSLILLRISTYPLGGGWVVLLGGDSISRSLSLIIIVLICHKLLVIVWSIFGKLLRLVKERAIVSLTTEALLKIGTQNSGFFEETCTFHNFYCFWDYCEK